MTTSNDIDSDFTIVSSERGGEVLLHKGYRYSKHRMCKSKNQVVWRCARRTNCNAFMVTRDKEIVKENIHKCEPDEAGNEITKKVKKCIERIVNEISPVTKIYADIVEEYNNTSFSTVKQMPKFENIKKILYNHRQKSLQEKIAKCKVEEEGEYNFKQIFY